ncbi:hypothetical protein Aph01nite_31440 [Acrocarpospora phusangensis]|uniref:Uncharacterized protein n=1 Tax=Acrocarpospora phusangensis TaxID=1070424 RepID=A0A919QBU4_9ACTN|nr:hypothetical protein Aph01nite_31440 [Acrocarpospora phusangensis]
MTRYRYAVLALILAGGFLMLVAATMSRGYLYMSEVGRSPDLGVIRNAVAALLIVWAVWHVVRGPAKTVPKLSSPLLTGGVDGLRRALYCLAAVQLAYAIVRPITLSIFLAGVETAVTAVVVVLFHRVLRSSTPYRWITTIIGVLGVLSRGALIGVRWFGVPTPLEPEVISLAAGLAPALWLILILVAQHRDGRWTWRALWPGWATLVVLGLLPLVLVGPDALYRLIVSSDLAIQLISTLYYTNVFGAVWAVRSAHGLADGAVAGAQPDQGGPGGVDVVDREHGGQEEGVVAGRDDPGGLGLKGGDAAVDEQRLGGDPPVVGGAREQ